VRLDMMTESEFRQLCREFQESHSDLFTPDGAYRKCSVCFEFPITEELTVIKLRGLACEVPNLHELWKEIRYIETQSLRIPWDFTYFSILYRPNNLVYDPSRLQFDNTATVPYICNLESLYGVWENINSVSASIVRISGKHDFLGIRDARNKVVAYSDKE
jgi:hypothetical protein